MAGKAPIDSEYQSNPHDTRTHLPPEKLDPLATWDRYIAEDVIQAGNTKAQSIWPFIDQTLRQFDLQGKHSPTQIINEAYLRGIQAINEGKLLLYPQAWLRSTSFNIIREFSRQEKKTVEINEIHESTIPANPTQDPDDDEQTQRQQQLARLKVVVEHLPPLEQRILELQFYKKQSWQKTAATLEEEGFGQIPLPTLRKRKSRVLVKLRKQLQLV